MASYVLCYPHAIKPKNVVGAASGISGAFSSIFGSIIATLSMGIIVDGRYIQSVNCFRLWIGLF
ncbi:hypothetical protein J3U66_05140 [Gilliamella sp. B2969]|uniref:hypothetical protein n=1 Tax=Gilliamella sp. B2969 TaxID=2818021 RepID=UPI002269EF50|nr:hypothetical protein [Gilliamella sp. B2969]MCX8729758.1 hypothetical protein [Gilliamella sp. B2969]